MNDVRKVKRELKLAEWKELLSQQARSGKSKYVWCEEQGINRDQFFYWQRIVRETLIEEAMIPGDETSLTQPVIPGSPRFARINLRGSSGSAGVAVNLRIGDAELNIQNGADIEVIERAIIAVGKIC